MIKFILICVICILLFHCSRAQSPSGKSNGSVADTTVKPPPAKTLEAVVVSGAKPYITQSSDKMTLNVAQSPLAAGGNAWEVILRAPGITEQNGSLSYNGKTVNVLINGRPTQLSGDDLKNMLANMPSHGIDKVELLSNPSARYDAQGGSIINIHLLKNQQLGANGSLTAGIGTGRFARGSAGAALNYRSKKLYLFGSYDFAFNRQYYDNRSHRMLDAVTTVAAQEYELRKKNNHAYKWGMDYDIDKNTSFGILLRGSINFRDRTTTDESIAQKTGGKDSSSIVNTNGYARFVNNALNVYYRKNFGAAGTELTVNGDYLHYRKTWTDDYTTHYLDDAGKEYLPPFLLRDVSPANNSIRSVTIDYVHPAKYGKWEAGLKTAYTTTDNDVLWTQQVNAVWETDSGKTNHFIYAENINAAYLSFSKTIKKYSLQLGLRAEQTNAKGELVMPDQVNRRHYFNLFPNIALQYARSKTQQFGLSYRKSIVRFGFDLVNPFVVYHSQYAYSQGNPAIQPMILHSVEFSYSWKNQVFAKAGYTFYQKVLGLLYREDPVTRAVISSYGNLQHADVYTGTLTWVRSLCKGRWVTTNTFGSFYSRYSKDPSNLDHNNAKVTGFVTTNNAIVLTKKVRAEITGYYYSPIASGVYQQESIYTIGAGLSATVMGGRGTLALNMTDVFNTLRVKNDVQNQQVDIHYVNKSESSFANLVFTWRFGNSRLKTAKTHKTGIEEEKSRMGGN